MNYEQAEQQYKKARTINGEKRKKLENNTYLLKEGEQYCVRLHETIVVRIYPDNTYMLNSGGWQTPTTKDRINKFCSPASIYQQSKVWYFSNGEEFFDGIIIANDGTIINPQPKSEIEDLDKKRKKLTKMINTYIKGFWMAVKLEKIGYPSGGDCWDCSLRTEDGQTLGEMSGHGHLISHMEENYFVPSLLFNAVKESHKNPEFVYQFIIESKSDWQTRTTLRRYFKQRYNELLELM